MTGALFSLKNVRRGHSAKLFSLIFLSNQMALDIIVPPEGRKAPMKIRDAFTFDDVLLEPARSTVLPVDTDISTQLTQSINLQNLLMSVRIR